MSKFQSAVALISVTDTETEAVMRLYDWQERYFEGDTQRYYEASFIRDGVS